MLTKAKSKRGAGILRTVEFRLKSSSGREVYLAGSFNNWDASDGPMPEATEGIYRLVLQIPPGRHEYRFVVDGEWYTDPQNPETVTNVYGIDNSVMTVQ